MRKNCVLAAAASVGCVLALASSVAAEPAKQADSTRPDSTRPEPPRPAPAASAPPARSDESSPKIVVHTGGATSAMTDARVASGAVRISAPDWSTAGPREPANASGTPHASHHVIVMPGNTMGPGEPQWRMSERADAERRMADAQIKIAEAQAERATRFAGRDRTAVPSWGILGYGYGGLGSGGWRSGPLGLRGPVTTTTTNSDALGSTAQRAYSDAAYPRLSGSTDARDAGVRQFGRDATPPIARPQEDVDRVHRKANTER